MQECLHVRSSFLPPCLVTLGVWLSCGVLSVGGLQPRAARAPSGYLRAMTGKEGVTTRFKHYNINVVNPDSQPPSFPSYSSSQPKVMVNPFFPSLREGNRMARGSFGALHLAAVRPSPRRRAHPLCSWMGVNIVHLPLGRKGVS